MNTVKRNTCIKCTKINEIIHQEKNVPISFSSVKTSNNYKFSTLTYGYCNECNILQLNELIEMDTLYELGHNYQVVGKTWGKYFNRFVEILNSYVEYKNVLEIGCPSGKIANKCDSYNSWNIIDPNVKNFENNKIIGIPRFFDDKSKFDFKIDVIVHSHLFEHIYNPLPFLENCHNILEDDGYMIFGMPNMEYIMKNNISLYFGVMFEHNIFHSVSNVIELLEQARFKIIDVEFYENHSIFFKVKKSQLKTNHQQMINSFRFDYNLKDKFKENLMYYDNCIYKWVAYVNHKKNKKMKNIYLFGASYNNHLLLHKIDNRLNIKGVLDNCKEKQGNFFYGFNTLILSPSILKKEDAIVILKNGVYNDEIKKQLLEMNDKTIVLD